jgi:hypothetical protein
VVGGAILGAIAELLDPPILGAAIDKALERRRAELPSLDRRPEIQRELRLVQERIDRALDALLDGGRRSELNARIDAEKLRRAALTDELARLDQQAAITDLDPAKLEQILWECLAEMEKLFGNGTPQVRQMLRALLADKIQMEPVDDGIHRGYLCRGVLTIDALLASAGITSLTVVAPTGFARWWDSLDSHCSVGRYGRKSHERPTSKSAGRAV